MSKNVVKYGRTHNFIVFIFFAGIIRKAQGVWGAVSFEIMFHVEKTKDSSSKEEGGKI